MKQREHFGSEYKALAGTEQQTKPHRRATERLRIRGLSHPLNHTILGVAAAWANAPLHHVLKLSHLADPELIRPATRSTL